MHCKRLKLLFTIMPLATLSNLATAQNLQLEEVVVTAQKRAESLQDVPISVSAISGDKIKEADIQGAEQLTSYVPNFQVVQDPIGDRINIRGIQSGSDAGFEQSVATFVDDVYRGRAVQSRFSFLDVGSVEVLRGPQPILFGKNTIAGAVNIRSARPTEEFEGEIAVKYNDEFDETEIQALFSGPLSDKVRARAVVLDRRMDEGWVENRAYDKGAPLTDDTFGRISLEWDISDTTLLHMRYEKGDWEVNGQPWVSRAGGPLQPFLDAGNIPSDGRSFVSHIGQNGFAGLPADPVLDFGSSNLFFGDVEEASVKLTHELESGSTLTAILGRSEYDYKRFVDAEFGPLPLLRFDDTEAFEQSSFELRIASSKGNTIDYIAGIYYQDNDLKADGLTQFGLVGIGGLLGQTCSAGGGSGAISVGDAGVTAATVAATVPGSTATLANACGLTAVASALLPAGVMGASRYHFLEQNSESWAIFAQPTWNVSDNLSLTLGVRYTEEEKTADQGAYATDYIARASTPLADPLSLQAQAAYVLGEFTPHLFTDLNRKEESLTWSLNIRYELSDTSMMYATVGTGFKAGGFNSFYMGETSALGANPDEVPFEEEEVLSYEIGLKMGFMDGRGELNAAIYRTEYDDLQASVFSGNTTFVVQNAAEAVSQGIELDARFLATQDLMLRGSLGYIDFEYESFPNQACVSEQFVAFRENAYQQAIASGDLAGAAFAALAVNNQSCSAASINDLAGRTSENTPEISAVLSAEYAKQISKSLELGLNLDAIYTDDTFRQSDLDPFLKEEAYWKLNAVLTLAAVSGKWDLSLIAKNLTDEVRFSNGNDTPLINGGRFARLDAPRSFAIRARYRF